MIRICSWCRQVYGFKCDDCGAPLRVLRIDPQISLLCRGNTPGYRHTPIVHSLLNHQPTHGICQRCSCLSDEDRANLAAQLRKEENT
jgi:hypothetical protein